MTTEPSFGEPVRWQPAAPRFRLGRTLVSWVVAAASVYIAAWVVPDVSLEETGGAFLVAAVLAVLNAVLPPILASLRLPFMLVAGFLLVLVVDALVLLLAADVLPDHLRVDSFGDALLAALVIAAASIVLQVILGTTTMTSTRSASPGASPGARAPSSAPTRPGS
jgi:putative membrane protein